MSESKKPNNIRGIAAASILKLENLACGGSGEDLVTKLLGQDVKFAFDPANGGLGEELVQGLAATAMSAVVLCPESGQPKTACVDW